MKILFIHRYVFFEPIGILTLSAVLKRSGHEVSFIDLKLEKNSIAKILSLKPDIIAYSVTTGQHFFYADFNKGLKGKLGFLSVFGGPHCTFFPEFIQEQGVDIICRGEGEYPLLELLDALQKKEDYSHIKNLWIKQSAGIIRNEMRNLIPDLDVLPFPDRTILDKYSVYRKKHMRFTISGRGCPYQCTYCFNHAYNGLCENKGNIIRRRSVDNFIAELKEMKNTYHPNRFKFWDDIFILNREWILEFCQKYPIEIGIPFRLYVRVNLIDEEIVKNLSEAGCILAEFGIESGNDKIRKSILKRPMEKEEIIKASLLLRKYGIIPMGLSIFGLPDETMANAMETLQLNIDANVTYGYSTVFHPYPMTELWNYSVQKGYFDGNIESTRGSFNFAGSPMKMKDVDKLVRFHYLFSFGVTFPFIKNILPRLCNYSLDGLYKTLYFIHKTWFYLFYLYEIDFIELLRDIFTTNRSPKKTFF